jgi:hypothetical protein
LWPLPSYSAYYNRQADAFLRGQTHLILKPPAGLLALPDPYDPVANRPYRKGIGVHDCVLYEGKFYLYWGPVPALLLATVKSLSGSSIIGDEWLVLAFTIASTLIIALLLRDLWRRYHSGTSPALISLGVIVYGLATPVTYFLPRPAVYEAAIVGGQFFSLTGVWLTVRAFIHRRRSKSVILRYSEGPLVPSSAIVQGAAPLCCEQERPDERDRGASHSQFTGVSNPDARCEGDERSFGVPQDDNSTTFARPPVPSRASLFLAGLCFAAAVGCRASLAVAVIAIALFVTIVLLVRSRSRISAAFPAILAFAAPLVIGAIALAAYNHVRFGSPLEFGQRYQLTGANYKATPALFSVANAGPSLWSYLLRPVAFQPTFPFVRARIGEGTFPEWISLPPYYESHETIVGLLISTPVIVLAALPLLQLFTRRRREMPRFAIVLMVLVAGVGFAPVIFMVGSTQRYLMDLWPGAAVLVTLGLWQVFSTRRTAALRATVATLIAWTIALGLLLGFTGYYDHFRTWNRPLYEMLGGQVPITAEP